ncbi:hypothetical protein M0R45_018349 [Rubus argutus]|uniref:Uncharacterized protein n=1 Tax=Rubus argutus TaxID=59490 RepID=A0AAW1X3W3_RUBAR
MGWFAIIIDLLNIQHPQPYIFIASLFFSPLASPLWHQWIRHHPASRARSLSIAAQPSFYSAHFFSPPPSPGRTCRSAAHLCRVAVATTPPNPLAHAVVSSTEDPSTTLASILTAQLLRASVSSTMSRRS